MEELIHEEVLQFTEHLDKELNQTLNVRNKFNISVINGFYKEYFRSYATRLQFSTTDLLSMRTSLIFQNLNELIDDNVVLKVV
jgi:hypothetical protein